MTTIGLDHQGFLGDTEEKICYQKSGIIKGKSAVVIGPTVIEEIVRGRMLEVGNDPEMGLWRAGGRNQEFGEENFLIF